MEILATAYLQYREGESISGGWERLEIVVKFREGYKPLRTKLKKTLVSTFQVVNANLSFRPLNSFDEYYSECEKYLNSERVKEVAEDLIKNHFSKKDRNTYKEGKKKEMLKRTSNLGKIEVKVTIK